MTQTLKLSDVREFLGASKYIQNNKIIPILDYILWDGSTLTKNNLATFCTMQIESQTQTPVLLDERSLQAIVSVGRDEHITVDITDRITLKCGKTKIAHALENPVNFTVIPKPTSTESHLLDSSVLSHLRYAYLFTHKGENPGNLAHIHLIDGMLFATNTFIFFITKHGNDLPNIIITPDEIPVLSGLGDVEYIPSERHNFYIAGNITYAFSKTEDRTPGQLTKFYDIFGKAPEQFMLQRSELSKVLDLILQINDDRDPIVNMKQNGEGIDITFAGMNSKDTDNKIWSSGNMPDEFTFNPKLVATLVKNYPSEVMNCMRIDDALIVKDGDTIIAIQKIMPVTA